MTTRGDYSSLPGTVEELAAEAERALLEQGGSDHPDAHTYAAQAGAAMRTFFEPWFDVPDPAASPPSPTPCDRPWSGSTSVWRPRRSVSELIEQTAVNTRDAAAHLRKVAALFVDTDEGVRRAMDELRRHERRIERRIEAEEAPETPQWPGGRPPHISRPGVTPW